MSASAPAIRSRVLEAARRTGYAFELLPTDPQHSDSAVFCEVHGYPLESAANALLLASKKAPKRFLLCIVLGTDRVDVNQRVREVFGERLSFASVEDMHALTGMEVGAVTPFGFPEHAPIYVDRKVMDQPWVIVGAGDRGAKLKLEPRAILTLPSAQVIDGLTSTGSNVEWPNAAKPITSPRRPVPSSTSCRTRIRRATLIATVWGVGQIGGRGGEHQLRTIVDFGGWARRASCTHSH